MLSKEEQKQVLTFIRNGQYSETSFLVFNKIFEHPQLAHLRDEFFETILTDKIREKLEKQTPKTQTDKFIIGSVIQEIIAYSQGIVGGIITKESFDSL